ncbi:hypothetical protein EDI_282480 [Entamoeba dispar SAW760]|uniref:Uncharacterized protein n=1 Tax=Entamoeba dispar (strain ATCC PRA-260 / SAW760) TaxID=370354 RepID=B0ENQ6_ENTDS|nr:uncharacterized protein EDI_282480 [Entamoeba dispar SAW760]EDR23840.1 hypothetical protein EDI_282480 [Entamoeba dispar SAW760]|eukprot:EDR23840.1 hypothetical protein EDI_282480 [Entamoeba dispar SAW760]
MNMLCFILFISVVMSKSLVVDLVKGVDGDPVFFMSLEFGKCYYLDDSESEIITHDGDKITIDYYTESSSCSGKKETDTFYLNDKDFKEEICDEDDCVAAIKKAPKHIGFEGIDDDENCSHRDETIRIYYTDQCYKSDGKYWNYEVEDGWMYSNSYPNDKCNTKERIEHNKEWECDICHDDTMQQCGTISTMITFVVISIFALIL